MKKQPNVTVTSKPVVSYKTNAGDRLSLYAEPTPHKDKVDLLIFKESADGRPFWQNIWLNPEGLEDLIHQLKELQLEVSERAA